MNNPSNSKIDTRHMSNNAPASRIITHKYLIFLLFGGLRAKEHAYMENILTVKTLHG